MLELPETPSISDDSPCNPACLNGHTHEPPCVAGASAGVQRHTADTITDDELDRLYADQARLTDQLANEQTISRRLFEQRNDMAVERYAWQERGDRAEATIARVRQLAERWRYTADRKNTALPELHAALNEPKE
ncbi:hypothetical protein [Streptomyces sp. 35G-GA-8]|uniref:hypothetical protein n=1 Tax=Streptomyces sp. 35G-GA-8 TaxID=2939434 RepID=UPI00201EE771|nr:hypothetical protein [Streptomyces sp. 35G-GA-8]MCL7377445.1 hypothetical protein [Streptomyces sp. 35G-GA-8]